MLMQILLQILLVFPLSYGFAIMSTYYLILTSPVPTTSQDSGPMLFILRYFFLILSIVTIIITAILKKKKKLKRPGWHSIIRSLILILPFFIFFGNFPEEGFLRYFIIIVYLTWFASYIFLFHGITQSIIDIFNTIKHKPENEEFREIS